MAELKKVNYIVIHHSVTSINTTFEQIRQMHLDKGWSDIGYHKVIDYNGIVYQGRKDSVIGAQAFGLNQESLGILCIGNFEEILPSNKFPLKLISSNDFILYKSSGILPVNSFLINEIDFNDFKEQISLGIEPCNLL